MNHTGFYKSSYVCPICGNEVPASELFCEKCGMRIHAHQPVKPNEGDKLHRTASTHVDMRQPSTTKYGLRSLSEMPDVKAVVDDCMTSLMDSHLDIDKLIENYEGKVFADIKDIIEGDTTDKEVFESLGANFIEERDFGLDKCTHAAKEIFNPGVIMGWTPLKLPYRMGIFEAYAKEVAYAFELVTYRGIIYKDFEEEDVLGENNGDGWLYLSNSLKDPRRSPFEIIDTITHELRHQYQDEAIRGHHNVPADVKEEWTIADRIYNDKYPCCFNPWGYNYNALEIDARYAGETVVRNVSHDLFNIKSVNYKGGIDRQQLRVRLSREGYDGELLEQTAASLLKLKGVAADMFRLWLNNGIRPEFNDIEGINSRFLREHYNMKDPAIILSYGMLLTNPVQNSKCLKHLPLSK